MPASNHFVTARRSAMHPNKSRYKSRLLVCLVTFIFGGLLLFGGCAEAPEPESEQTAVSTTQPSATPMPTATLEPTITPSQTAPPTPTETATIIPTPTVTPEPTSTFQNLSARDSQLISIPRLNNYNIGPTVYALAVSPDDKHLAVASDQGLLIYDLSSLELIVSVDESGNRKYSVAWSPDGKRLVFGTGNYVWIWNFETETTEHIFSGHEAHLSHVTWSPTLPLVYSIASDGTLGAWDIETGTPLDDGVANYGANTIQFSPNGQFIGLNQGPQLFVVDLDSGTIMEFAEEHTDAISSISWYPGGTFFCFWKY